MTWIKREVDLHRCTLPTTQNSSGVRTGDQWQCDDCSAIWQVRVEDDQREPGKWFTWTKSGMHKP